MPHDAVICQGEIRAEIERHGGKVGNAVREGMLFYAIRLIMLHVDYF